MRRVADAVRARFAASNLEPIAAWTAECLNCGAALTGPFCAACGQRAIPPDPTVRELAGDAFAELSGWDGKFVETFKALVRSPGELTRAFVIGKRARYIAPVRLYLTLSVIYFLVATAAPILRPAERHGVSIGPVAIGVS